MLEKIEHIVVLMLENRSFDHMLGFLYEGTGHVSPLGHPFEGLTGSESNPDGNGKPVPVFRIQPSATNPYRMPGANPGEGFQNTHVQLFGSATATTPAVATCNGFVKNFAATIGTPNHAPLPGTVASNIMGMFTPDMLPILSGLARGYAVCDHWFASVPSETMPNRAFALAATSLGSVSDPPYHGPVPTYATGSIFGALSAKGVSWMVYGYTQPAYTRNNFKDTYAADESHFGLFAAFQKAAASGTLAAFSFLEPSWGSAGNSQHPNNDVRPGEQLLHDVYYALRHGPAAQWNSTLLIITYDEHGGCYDHVPPPLGATPPDALKDKSGFDFTRFGVRVPTVLVSPLIAAGTVFRAPAGSTPLDHTSILKTVETRWGLPPLTKRDAAAIDVGGVLTLASPRTDDPLATTSDDAPSHLQLLHAGAVSQLPIPGEAHPPPMPKFESGADAETYIEKRTKQWVAARRAKASGATPTRSSGKARRKGTKRSAK
jgi:phospholipase C